MSLDPPIAVTMCVCYTVANTSDLLQYMHALFDLVAVQT